MSRKVDIPGFYEPTIVATKEELTRLLRMLPRNRTKRMTETMNMFYMDKHATDDVVDMATRTAPADSDDPQAGYVYAAYSTDNGMKVGMTCRESPMYRVGELSVAVRHPYELVDFIRSGNPVKLERFVHCLLHTRLATEHSRELFDATKDEIAMIFNTIREYTKNNDLNESDSIDVAHLDCFFKSKCIRIV